jgi:hypothetical protein
MYKKISYILTVALALGFAACSDQGDVVDQIIEDAKDNIFSAQVEYTLTAADYSTVSTAAAANATTDAEKDLAAAAKTTLSLNSFATANEYIPALVATAYPGLSDGSTAQVTYAYSEGRPAYLSNLAASPTEIIVSENFEGYNGSASPYETWNKNGWSHIVTKGGGTKYWQIRSYSGNLYGQVSANGGVAEETEIYVVSPAITLSKPTGNAFLFDMCVGYWNHEGLSVLITEDAKATTEPASIGWTDVTESFNIPTEPASGYGVISPAGSISLDKYVGKTIYIAFRYNGETGMGNPNRTTTYQIDNVKIVNGDPDVIPVPGATYINDGESWEIYDDGISLTDDDYAAIGVTSLYPDTAPNYLPVFLAQKFPYAQEGDIKAVVYSDGTDEYAFTDGKWASTATPVTMTSQFVYSTDGWMFDPTVNYTMATADHQMMVDYMLADPERAVFANASYKNEEFYYGFGSRYSNVSFRLSYRDSGDSYEMSKHDTELQSLAGDDMAQVELLWKRLIEKGLPLYMGLKWPAATAQVQGIDVMYNITLVIFYPDGVTYQSGSTQYFYTFTYKVTKDGTAGSPPTFEYVSCTGATGAPSMSEFYTK